MGQIRDATEGDIEAMVELKARTWHKAYPGIVPLELIADLPLDVWREEVSAAVSSPEADSFARVVELEDEIVGYCLIAAPAIGQPAGSPIAEVVSLYVDPAHWGRGAGRALLGVSEAAAAEAGCAGMILWSFERNAQARAFFARLGWTRDGESRKHETIGVDTVRLRRALQPPE